MSDNRTFLITDISGNAVTGLTSGFTTAYLVDGEPVSGASITVTETVESGFYNVNVSLVPEGNLFLKLEHTDPNNYIAPDWHEWNKDSSYTIDDVYGRIVVATSTTSLPVVPSQRYSVITINTKEGDDLLEVAQVPARYRPLTGWTNLSVQAYPSARLLDMTTPPISGTYDVTVLNETDGVIQVEIGSDVTTGVVPNGVASATIYADVQGDDVDGKRKTMIEYVISVKRDFNTN